MRLEGLMDLLKAGMRRAEPKVGVHGAGSRGAAVGQPWQDGRCEGCSSRSLVCPTGKVGEVIGGAKRTLYERHRHQVDNALKDRPSLCAPA